MTNPTPTITSPTTITKESDMTATKTTQPVTRRVRWSLLRTQQLLLTLFLFRAPTGRSGQERVREEQDERESGVTTLEIAVIALGLFLLAGVVVAAITAAVNNNLGQIG